MSGIKSSSPDPTTNSKSTNLNFHEFFDNVLSTFNQFFLLQPFLDFLDFWFNVVYNSIIFSSALVLLSNLDLRSFFFCCFFLCPHINSVNRGMPVLDSDHLFYDKNLKFLIIFSWAQDVYWPNSATNHELKQVNFSGFSDFDDISFWNKSQSPEESN